MPAAIGLRGRGLLLVIVFALSVGATRSQPAQAAPTADNIIHIVQPGDNLYRIGLQYGVSWTDIMRANQLPDTTIYVGEQLIIPVAGTAPEATPTAEPPTTEPPTSGPPTSEPPTADTPTPAAQPSTYVVQDGDSLGRIAQSYGVTVAAIVAANNISNPSLIFAGQVLIIPIAGADSPPPPAATGSNKEILIDISEQRMMVYQDNALVWDWVVSTGEPGLDTLPGTYSVLDKIPNAYAYTWDLQMPNWLGIYWAGALENGIHALPILSNGQRLWDGYLGTKVSFGCVILGIQEAQTLYDWAEVGTPVIIQN